MSKIRLTMRSAFQQLKRLKLVPETWTKICHLGRKLYLLTVYQAHPELTYCDNFWKAEQLAIDNFPSWHNNHVRIRKESVKKEEPVDSKLPSPKRCNSPPAAIVSSKKARTEINLGNDTDDGENEDIYYGPGLGGVTVDSCKAVVIDNPLSTLFAEQQAPVMAVSATLNRPASESATGASVDQILQLSMDSNIQKSTLTLPAPAPTPVAPAFSATSPIGSIDTDKLLEDTRLVEPSNSPRNQPAPPETSQRVPLSTIRSRKPRRATVGKVDNPKNRCKSAWLEQHPNGDEEEFKVYWNGVKGSYKG
ncbi:hypothetical protein AB1N83_002493 [Pleurotus pulmonarius]